MIPQNTSILRKILYASYQEDESLPGYIRYALAGLVQTGFTVAYLTNRRDLDPSSHAFLDSHHIELFFTDNHGYDFGMWRRYIQYTAKFRREEWERLVLVNDSIVYYQNRFNMIFAKAEDSGAEMFSLTENDEYAYHLQSFFLYLKPKAISVFFKHILKEPEGEDFYDTVKRLEVGTSIAMQNAGIKLEALYHTDKKILFSYPKLISQKAGFVKRKLLESRFTRDEIFHFWKNGEAKALSTDYAKLIEREGAIDKDFDKKWLVTKNEGFCHLMKKIKTLLYRIHWELSKAKARGQHQQKLER